MDQVTLMESPTLRGPPADPPRHSLALEFAMRPLFAYLRAVVTPTAVFAASEDWAGGDGGSRALGERVRRAAGELADLVTGLPARAPADTLQGPFGGTPSFEELLREN